MDMSMSKMDMVWIWVCKTDMVWIHKWVWADTQMGMGECTTTVTHVYRGSACKYETAYTPYHNVVRFTQL